MKKTKLFIFIIFTFFAFIQTIAMSLKYRDFIKELETNNSQKIKQFLDVSACEKENLKKHEVFLSIMKIKKPEIIKMLAATGDFLFKDYKYLFNCIIAPINLGKEEFNIEVASKEGQTVYTQIFEHAKKGNIIQLSKLAKDFTLNIKDSNGNTPLHFAVLNNNKLMTITILGYNPFLVSVKNNAGKTPIDLAVEDKHNILELFVNIAI